MADSNTVADLVVKLRADFGDVQSQFDALMDQLHNVNARSNEGKQAIKDLSEAFEEILKPVDSMKTATQATTESIDDFINGLEKGIDSRFGATTLEEAAAAQKANEDATRSAAEASALLDDALGGVDESFKQVEEMTRAEKKALEDAKQEYRETADEAEHLGEANHHAAEGMHEMMEELLKLGGIAYTVEKLKELIQESILAAGAEEQLTTSLDLLGAGADGAKEKVEELKELANQLAVPFSELSGKARELAAAFGTGEGLNAVLIGAGNAAAATGRSFSTVATSIERIDMTGQIAGRQLLALGLKWEDLAATMGVSMEVAQQRLKKGGQSAAEDVQVVLDTIQTKFGDAAARQAENTLGKITILKNRIEYLFADLGQNLTPIVDAIFLAVQAVATVMTTFVGLVAVAVDTVIGLTQVTTVGLTGIAQTALAMLKGNFAEAVIAANTTVILMKDAMAEASANIIRDQSKTTSQLAKIWDDTGKKIQAAFDGVKKVTDQPLMPGDKTKWAKDLTDGLQLLVDQEKIQTSTHKAAIEEAARFNETMGTTVNTIDYLAMKTALAAENMRSLGKAIGPEMAVSPWFVNPPVTSWNAMALAEKAAKDGMDNLTKSIDTSFAKVLADDPYGKLAESAQFFGITTTQELQKVADDSAREYQRMKESGIASATDVSVAFLKMRQAQIDAARSAGTITRAEYDETSSSIKAGLDNLTGTSNRTGKAMKSDLEQVSKVVSNDLVRGLDSLIFRTGKVGDAFKKLGMDVAGVFEKEIIGAIEKMVSKWIENLIIGKAEQSTVDAGAVTGQAGVAGAAGFASVMAAIPFPFNVALAPEVAGAAAATVEGTFLPMATFDLGGRVPEDMVAMVHGGEHVLTDDLTRGLEHLVATGGLSADAGGITIDMSHGNWNGVTPNLVQDIGNQIAYKIRQVAGNKSKF